MSRRPRPRPLCALAPSALIAAALFSAACRSGGAPVDDDAGVDASASRPQGMLSLELRNEPVDEVLQKLASAAGKAFVIDPEAQAVAHCARITLFTGGDMPAAGALGLVREAIEASGFSLVESETGGIVVRRSADRPLPATCQRDASADAPPAEPGWRDELSEKFAAGVRRISDTEYEVTRAALDLLLESGSSLARLVRVVPVRREGQVAGMRLFSIRPKNAFGVLGFRNGDVVTHLAGQALTSPEEVVKMSSRLKDAKTLDVTIERHGKTSTIIYRIL